MRYKTVKLKTWDNRTFEARFRGDECVLVKIHEAPPPRPPKVQPKAAKPTLAAPEPPLGLRPWLLGVTPPGSELSVKRRAAGAPDKIKFISRHGHTPKVILSTALDAHLDTNNQAVPPGFSGVAESAGLSPHAHVMCARAREAPCVRSRQLVHVVHVTLRRVLEVHVGLDMHVAAHAARQGGLAAAGQSADQNQFVHFDRPRVRRG